MLLPSTGKRELDLFSLDVRGLDDRPPLVNFGLVKGAERLRRLLLAGKNLLPQVGKPRAHGGIGERLDDHSIELGDYVGRRALGRPQTMPKRRIERGSSRLEMRQDFVGRHAQFDSFPSVKTSAQAAVILVPLRKACSRNSKLRPKMKE